MPNGTNQWIPNTPWTTEATQRANQIITQYLTGQGARPTTNALVQLLRYAPTAIQQDQQAYDPLWFQKYLPQGSVLSPEVASALTNYLANIAESTGIDPSQVLQQYRPSFSLSPQWQSILEAPQVGLAQTAGFTINPFTGTWERGIAGPQGWLGGVSNWVDSIANLFTTALQRAIDAVVGGTGGVSSPK